MNALATLAIPSSSGQELSMIDVRAADATDQVQWDAFVDAHPAGTFFHLYAWHEVLQRSVNFVPLPLIAKRAGQVIGVLPLMRVKSLLFGHALVSLPFCVQGGILAESLEASDALLARARALAEESKVDYLELRHSAPLGRGLVCKNGTYVNFKREISPQEDENMKAIPRKQRAMVRKGIAAGLESHEEEDLAVFFNIYATSVRNLGTPVFPQCYFTELYRTFREQCRITTVYHERQPVASVLSFKYKNAVMPYYGGGLPIARDLKAYDFMYWEVMRTACTQGFTSFDYGRSKVDSGSYAFKKNWGFEPSPLAYEYHLVGQQTMPDRNPNNPKYALAVNAWKRLPLPIANALGGHIAPYLA